MENIIVWGFCKPKEQKIIEEIKKKINVEKWYGFSNDSINIQDFLSGKNSEYVTKPTKEAVKDFQLFEDSFFSNYLTMITRRGLNYKDTHELKNEFACQFYYFHSVLSKAKSKSIVFSNLQHEGPDYILYQLAKKFNIKTIMCYQSLFKNRFFCIDDLEDFGTFQSSVIDTEHGIHFEPSEQRLFYMEKIVKEQESYHKKVTFFEKIRLTVEKHRNRFKTSIKKRLFNIKLFLKENEYGDIKYQLKVFMGNPSQVLLDRPLLTIYNKSQRLLHKRRFKSNSKRVALGKDQTDAILRKHQKIAYFPLHLQPELTTATLGGVYQDQCYATEKLRSLLDEDWIILVKENPKQRFYQRGEGFYQRLSQLENTYLVDAMYPSQLIIDKASITATISGTAGWEAIKSGKKALIFGHAWYSNLGNCIQVNEGTSAIDVKNLLENNQSMESIETNFNNIMTRTYLGVVDMEYEVMVDNFDEDINAKNVSNSLLKALYNL